MLPSRSFQPGDFYQHPNMANSPGNGIFFPSYGGFHPALGMGGMGGMGAGMPQSAVLPTPAPAPVTAPPPVMPTPPRPAPISPLLAMAMQQQMGSAQPQASSAPTPMGMGGGQPQGMPQGQPMQGGSPYQNFIPPIQATPYNYQGGRMPMPLGGMWNQVAQQMAGPNFMQPGTTALSSGFNPSLVAAPQGPHNIAQPSPVAAPAGGGLASLSPYLPAMGY